MSVLKQSVAVLALGVVLSACGGGGSNGGGGSGAIDPASEPSAVMEAILIKVDGRNAILRDGDPPAPTNAGGEPVLRAANDVIAVPSGGNASLSLDFETSAAVEAIFAKVVGADRFAEVLLAAQTQSLGTKAMEQLVLDLTVPSNIGAGQFCVEISGRDAQALVSNTETVCFDVDDSTIKVLQGTWDFACNPASDGSESFEGSWTFDGTDVLVTESVWPNNACLGSPENTYNEQLTVAVGNQVQAADGEPANAFDIRNLSENDRFFTLIRVEGGGFQLALAPAGSGGSAETRANSFASSADFTRRPESVSSARACFNPVLWQEGTEVVQTVRYEGRNDGDFGGTPGELEFSEEFTETRITDGEVSFDGRTAIRIRSLGTQDGGQGDPVDEFTYFQVDFARPSFALVGDETRDRSTGAVIDSETLSPAALVAPFDLAEGESVTQTIVIEENDVENDDNETNTVIATTTYIGRETVQIDGRSIETCRFDTNLIDGDGDGLADGEDAEDPFVTHYSVESGLEVLFYELEPDNGVRTDQVEVLSATINGVTVDD
ncbi:hypothetical protein [Algiphilus sp.]|uniref:hypothetical protein n=1 Tax=Algiphilus sp. TaxID=1872431 RepID=UPI0032EEE518